VDGVRHKFPAFTAAEEEESLGLDVTQHGERAIVTALDAVLDAQLLEESGGTNAEAVHNPALYAQLAAASRQNLLRMATASRANLDPWGLSGHGSESGGAEQKLTPRQVHIQADAMSPRVHPSEMSSGSLPMVSG